MKRLLSTVLLACLVLGAWAQNKTKMTEEEKKEAMEQLETLYQFVTGAAFGELDSLAESHELKRDRFPWKKWADKTLIITDPMLATGSSMELAYEALRTKGHPAHIHVASIIASKQAIEYIQRKMPDDITTVWVAAIDDELDDHSYIVPGLGDAGDLSYGEKE